MPQNTWGYWNDQNWNGSQVTMTAKPEYLGDSADSEAGSATFSFTATGHCTYGMQITYRTLDVEYGKYYTLDCVIDVDVDCVITVNGNRVELKAGSNDVSVKFLCDDNGEIYPTGNYTNLSSAVFIQMGSAVDDTMVEAATITISQLHWTEYTPEALAAPTLSVSGTSASVSDPNEADHVSGYEIGFGYGLSYTDFAWSVDSVSWTAADDMAADVTYTVKVTVKNTGSVTGKDVVELYYTPPYTEGGVEVASVNLLAFAKTGDIEPGKTETVELTFTAYDLASYDDYDKNNNDFVGYETLVGDYQIRLMRNAHEEGVMEEGDSSYLLYSPGVQFPNDPVTGEPVENRFTGEDAYAGVPIDGSTAIPGGVDYLSRANNFANYPTQRVGTPNQTAAEASVYEYDGNDDADVSDIQYGVDSGLYLVQVENEDGTTSRATLAMLEGTEEAMLFNSHPGVRQNFP